MSNAKQNADFLLLDRSGSMAKMWTEALAAVNAYAKKLADEKVDTRITAAVFDGEDGKLRFEVLRDAVKPQNFAPLTNAEATPRGMTPLNDATGKIVAMADEAKAEKTAVIIMTDGDENYSRELSVDAAKALLDERRRRGYQVIMLGMEFNNAAQAKSYGVARGQSISSTRTNLSSTLTSTASNRADWSTGLASGMAYTAEQQKAAADNSADA